MKFTQLRRYLKNKNLTSQHVLEKCDLVIDGDSFFKDTYRHSECQFVLGPDCDRYADFIIKKLSLFLENDVKCYVVFSGASKHDLNKRREIHQSIIDERNVADVDKAAYFEPLFVKDIQKQVLVEMHIKYFVCEYDSIGAIVGVARKFKCAVLTNNVEYSVFGVSCIPTNSIEHENGISKLNCKIYEHEKVISAIGVYSKMPVLLALLNDNGDYLESIRYVIEDAHIDDIWPVIRWVRRQRESTIISTVSKIISVAEQNKAFMEVYNKIQVLYLYPLCNLAVKYFQRDKAYSLFRDDKKWFGKGVANGRIALPYINLKKRGVIFGSLLMNDSKRPDALRAALDIVTHGYCLLTNSQDSKITFLERSGNKSTTKEIDVDRDKEKSNIFTKRRYGKICVLSPVGSAFDQFLNEVLPGLDNDDALEALGKVLEESWILIITLVYYVFKKNKGFVFGAYCILLSYFMLGPISKMIDSLKSNSPSVSISNSANDCVNFYNGLRFLFDKINLKQKYDSSIVHDFSEIQHCLQHMNYLNNMCGGTIACTVYHDTYNATFIYNTFLFMKDKENLMKFLENKFTSSRSLQEFKNIVTAFENCLSAVEAFARDKNCLRNVFSLKERIFIRRIKMHMASLPR